MHSNIPMRVARGGDELAQLLHPICNIRVSEIKIKEPTNKATVVLWVIKERVVINCKLGNQWHRSRGGASNSQTNITNQIDNVFSLAEIHATRVTGNLDTKKKMGMTKILNGKNRVQEGLDLNQKVFMSASNKIVINVDNKGQKGVTTALCKEVVVM